MNRIGWTVFFVVCVAVAVPARADDQLFLAGGEASDVDYYTYAGLILPGPGRKDGRGAFGRLWIDQFGYEYDQDTRRIDASAYGGEIALGYGRPLGNGWGSASVGLRYTDTSLSPDDRSATARGGQVGAKFQLDGEQQLAPGWRLGAIASYTIEEHGYWGRVRLMRRVSDRLSVGLESVAGGNDDYDSAAGGLVLTLQPGAGGWSYGFKTGYRRQDGDGAVYGGLELWRAF